MYSKEHLVCQILIMIISQMDLCRTAIYLKGSSNFEPCSMQTDSRNSKIVDIYCDTKVSLLFGDELPIIKAESYLIRSIVIKGNSNLKRCQPQTYQDITVQNVNMLKTLIIEDSHLTDFETGCFDNLKNLEILHLRNQYRTDSNSMARMDQQKLFFNELSKLTNLQELYLENINLSMGLPKFGFDGWCRNLKILRLSNNQLSFIHNDAFKQTNQTEPCSLNELYLEQQQPDGWKLLGNSNQWASELFGLRKLSMAGTILDDPYENLLRLDLGNYVNHRLVSLNLENCGLLDLIDENLTGHRKLAKGLNLIHIGEQLEELFIGQNRFGGHTRLQDQAKEDNQQQVAHFLIGLKKFTRLRILGLDHNQLPFHTLPDWFGSRKRVLPRLEEFRLAGSGLTKLTRQTLPPSIRTLDLSENPLRTIDPDWANHLDHLDRLYLNYIRLITVQIGPNQADWGRAFSNSLTNTLEHLSFIGCQLRSTILRKPTPIQQSNELINETSESSSDDQNRSSSQLAIAPNLGLDKLDKLKTLILTENYLTYIPGKALQYLTQLESLVLTNNHLVSVEEYDDHLNQSEQIQPSRKSRLRRLDLSHNQLTSLDRCAYSLGFGRPLEDLLPLRPIWLRDEMTSSDSEDFGLVGVGSQKRQNEWFGGLNLMHNPWICDCRLGWLRYFVDQMTDRIQNVQSNHRLPSSYLTYLNEALNFSCKGQNKWTGMKFLSLQINDLYEVNHTHCMERRDIYGWDARNMTLLKPCSTLNRSFTSRSMIASSKSMNFLIRKLDDTFDEFVKKEEVSKEAGIMIIVAGAAALCFMIISIAIIVWLCIRLRKHETLIKTNNSSSGGSSSRPSRELSNGSKFQSIKCAHLCSCCVSDEKRTTSATSVRSRNGRTGGRATKPIRMGVSNNQGQTEMGHYELSDPEEAITTSTAKSSLARRIRKRNRELRVSVNPERARLVHSGQPKTSLSASDQNLKQVRLRPGPQKNEEIIDTRSHPASIQLAQMGSTQTLDHGWFGNRPPKPSTPLPPLPLPRKTKSTADLRITTLGTGNGTSTGMSPTHYSIGAMIGGQQGTITETNKSTLGTVRIRDPKKGLNMNVLAGEISSQMNKVRELERPGPVKDRKGYYIMLPWRSKSADTDKCSESRKSSTNRPQTCADCGPKCSARSSNWFHTSSQRLQNGFKWIKRKRTRPDKQTKSTDPNASRAVLRPKDSLKGPELPKPYFLIPKQPDDVKSPHDYLPMSAEEQQRQQQHPSAVDTTASTATTFTSDEHMNYVDDPNQDDDEYVTDLAEASATNRASYIQRHINLRRKPSDTDGNQNKPVRPPRHHRLQLTNDTYGMSLIDSPGASPNSLRKRVEKGFDFELPPPPPPPPYLLNKMPHMNQDKEGLTRIAMQNQVPVVTSKVSTDSSTKQAPINATVHPPPPLLPKPRHIVVIRHEPGRREKQGEHTDLEHDK